MGKSIVTAAWVWETERRQLPRRFGPSYLAVQKSTTWEAAPGSRPKTIYSLLLQRYLHAMSVTEQDCIPVALHHPRVIELWDQWMCNPQPEPHLAQSHPRARSIELPASLGTLRIAERMGMLRKHPAVRNPEDGSFVPVPLLGDLLLFLLDDRGPYCVHWDVKRTEGAHGLPLVDDERHAGKRKVANARFKHDLRCTYLRELAIPNVLMHRGLFDAELVKNLRRLCSVHPTVVTLPDELQAEIIDAFRESLPAARPPLEVIAKFVKRGVPGAKVTELLDHAIWYRKLRVDLFQEVRTDLPLCAEVVDPFERYKDFFSRGGPLVQGQRSSSES